MDATSRAVMRALVCRGHYPETPDGFRDAVVASTDIVAASRTEPSEWNVGKAICDALYPPSTVFDDDWMDRYEADQDAVWDALRTAARDVA